MLSPVGLSPVDRSGANELQKQPAPGSWKQGSRMLWTPLRLSGDLVWHQAEGSCPTSFTLIRLPV